MSEFACSSCGIQGNIEPGESVGAGHTVLQLQEGMLAQLFESQSDQQQQKNTITILSRKGKQERMLSQLFETQPDQQQRK
jgi:hypothetical protein